MILFFLIISDIPGLNLDNLFKPLDLFFEFQVFITFFHVPLLEILRGGGAFAP